MRLRQFEDHSARFPSCAYAQRVEVTHERLRSGEGARRPGRVAAVAIGVDERVKTVFALHDAGKRKHSAAVGHRALFGASLAQLAQSDMRYSLHLAGYERARDAAGYTMCDISGGQHPESASAVSPYGLLDAISMSKRSIA